MATPETIENTPERLNRSLIETLLQELKDELTIIKPNEPLSSIEDRLQQKALSHLSPIMQKRPKGLEGIYCLIVLNYLSKTGEYMTPEKLYNSDDGLILKSVKNIIKQIYPRSNSNSREINILWEKITERLTGRELQNPSPKIKTDKAKALYEEALKTELEEIPTLIMDKLEIKTPK